MLIVGCIISSCSKKPATNDQLNHPQQLTPLRELVANSVYGETHAYSEWNNRYWEVFGEKGGEDYYALTTSISTDIFDSICGLICCEYGEPTYTDHNFPESLIPKADTGTFWMTAKQNDRYYYWCNDSLVIGFSLADSYPSGIGYAYLSIKFLSPELALCWSKGKDERRIDSLQASKSKDFDIWRQESMYFKDERHRRFVNKLEYNPFKKDDIFVYVGKKL